MKGRLGKSSRLLHPFGPTLKNSAIGIEHKAPITADLALVLFQKSPSIKMASIPGLTTPVHSCINWNAWSIFPSIGAIIMAIIKAIKPEILPTVTKFFSEAVLLKMDL